MNKNNKNIEANEDNDCSVVAVRAVTNLPYNDVHAAFKRAGRKDKQGSTARVIDTAVKELGLQALYVHFDDDEKQSSKVRYGTLKHVIKEIRNQNIKDGLVVTVFKRTSNKGNYRGGHDIAIVDGDFVYQCDTNYVDCQVDNILQIVSDEDCDSMAWVEDEDGAKTVKNASFAMSIDQVLFGAKSEQKKACIML